MTRKEWPKCARVRNLFAWLAIGGVIAAACCLVRCDPPKPSARPRGYQHCPPDCRWLQGWLKGPHGGPLPPGAEATAESPACPIHDRPTKKR